MMIMKDISKLLLVSFSFLLYPLLSNPYIRREVWPKRFNEEKNVFYDATTRIDSELFPGKEFKVDRAGNMSVT
ncbi:hypothetical protein BA70_08945 [Bacillus zhangzhouensis]|uniref:Uncharacterized protein n=1 Tax=Bacillus zhangzhouensis TaxID=1178540 RepID=A0A081L841_9BACI|nr:hypothetical protein BA70_08945 [Bacillus zhangzhouensis]